METKIYKNNELREIDLSDLSFKLFSKIKKFFKKIYAFFSFILMITTKYFYILLIILLFSIISGYIIYKITPEKYFSDIIIKTNGFTVEDIILEINYFKNLCKTKNYGLLSNLLKIDIKTVSKIKKLEIYYYLDINNDNIGDIFTNKIKMVNDTSKGKKILSQCLIRLIFTSKIDSISLSKLQTNFLNNLCKNEYINTLFLTFINEQKNLFDQIDNEIKKLDSLQKVEYFIEKNKPFYFGGSNMAIFSQQPTQLYYKDILNLIKIRNEVLKVINISKEPITVINKFNHPLKIEKKISVYITISVILFLSIFYIFIFSIYYYKNNNLC